VEVLMWKIRAAFNETFFWSNTWGWVDEAMSDSFTIGERASLSLPDAGHWLWCEDVVGTRSSRARAFAAELVS
jgi:hypothetical protein